MCWRTWISFRLSTLPTTIARTLNASDSSSIFVVASIYTHETHASCYSLYFTLIHRHSLYPTPNGSDEDEDNEGYDFWYSYGAIPKFRANAAYSLYGILKSDGGSSSSDACHKGTYINSFFTNRGVETLTYPFGIGNGETSQCGAKMNGNGDEDGGRFLSGDGGDGGSYGLGCYDGQFVYGQYSAGDCMGYIESVSDTMDDLNAALESLECIQVSSIQPTCMN